MASTRASISKVSKRPKINIIPPKQLFVDLTQDDTKTPSPKLPNSSPSAPNAPSKTPSTKDTSSSSIDYIPKSPTSSTSPSPNGYLNPSTSPPPRVSPPPPTQDNASMDITLTLSPNTPLDVQFDTPSPSPPIIAHPIPWNFLEAHDYSLTFFSPFALILSVQRICSPSSSLTTLSNSSRNQTCNLVSPSFSVYTPTPPQVFEIGKCSDKMYLKHHEKQVKDILNYLDELYLHRIERIKEGRINGNKLKTELKRIRTQIIRLQKKRLGQNDKIAFAHYRISDLEQIIEKIQARYQTNQEYL
ncbi:hypothetical protein Tco_1054791 [Tanacetum coccineum]|uniref:Uncharacterized protein n=1 Tax=Tanacetum coccineum TaxID=301880 RepID=A0ABQ5GYQ2_9ASTR